MGEVTFEQEFKLKTGKNPRGHYFKPDYVMWLEKRIALAIARFTAAERVIDDTSYPENKQGYIEWQDAIAAYDKAMNKTQGGKE